MKFSTIALGLLFTCTAANAKPGGFYIERLPRGANITMPQPATTYVGIKSPVSVTATDTPQNISLTAIHTENGKTPKLKVSIYDQESKEIRFIEIKPNVPYIYKFKRLESVTILPQYDQKNYQNKLVKLRIESDKALQIAH